MTCHRRADAANDRRAAGVRAPVIVCAIAALQFAAAPVFAAMALLTAGAGGDAIDVICAASQGASPLHGMTVMYVLMSVLHASPWLRLMQRV